MKNADLFQSRPDDRPTIYAYRLYSAPNKKVEIHPGYIKVGYTRRSTDIRVVEQTGTAAIYPDILLTLDAMRQDGSIVSDHDVHTLLESWGFIRLTEEGITGREWFNCSKDDIESAVKRLRDGIKCEGRRNKTYSMRPEQEKAVQQTIQYFNDIKRSSNKAPRFLWNAKMRFGKTFAAYQLAKRMNFKKILVLTFKPAVESAWLEDLETHIDFMGWQFISNKNGLIADTQIDDQYNSRDKDQPVVVFGSFQDLLGRDRKTGGIKAKNAFIHQTHWDLVIFDEYHYGAWRERSQDLFSKNVEEDSYDVDMEEYSLNEAGNAIGEQDLPISTDYYLFLSGTPFRAINTGEFIEEQIFNWTYSDEQKAKENWDESRGENPYLTLPRVVMMTYKLPDELNRIAARGENNEFDLNEFFAAEGEGVNARFTHIDEVQKWLDLIRGSSKSPTYEQNLKLPDNKKAPFPFNTAQMRHLLQHTLWFLPKVNSCEAMYNLLTQKQNSFFHDYKVIICAGDYVGIGVEALKPVREAMANPLETKTITLTCGKLTTGVTVAPWTGILMLRNLSSPETYFQSAFRVQSPWANKDGHGEWTVYKKNCYIFDFALNRALRQISDYGCKLDTSDEDRVRKIEDFIRFLPVIAHDGSDMEVIDAEKILDMTITGTTATLLARKWKSAILVRVDDEMLNKVRNNPQALASIMKIKGLSNFNRTIDTIITRHQQIRDTRRERENLSEEERKQLSDEERKLRQFRSDIQDKLLKFLSRIPVFMYLTDYREQCLDDIIHRLDTDLFREVTGLEISDFDLLTSIGVFNKAEMNNAIFYFKRYEDDSFKYIDIGIDKHSHETRVGLMDTVISTEEFKRRK